MGIPGLASLILKHDVEGEVPGISAVPREEQPPVGIVFWSFRVMVSLGLLMIGFALAGLILRRGGRYWQSQRFLKGLTWMGVTPFIAVLAGWFVTEVGRSPWIIQGAMNYSQGVTPSLTGGMALFTLIGYILVYALVFAAGVYYLLQVFRAGLEEQEPAGDHDGIERPKRPMSAAHVPLESEGGNY